MKGKDLEITAQLNRVGWHKAKAVNLSLFFGWLPDERGGLLFGSKAEAEQGERAINDLVAAFRSFMDAADRLAPKQREIIRISSVTSDEFDRGEIADPLQLVFEDRLAAGILNALEATDREIADLWTSSGGRPRVHAGYRVAEEIAEIYVLGMGARPTVGTKPDSDEPSTLFAEVTRNVFDLLGINLHFRRPCEEAVQRLGKGPESRFEQLMRRRKNPKPLSLLRL